MSEQMMIRVEFSPAALWGEIEPRNAGYDEQLSQTRFADLLWSEIQECYPGADIEVNESINDRVFVDGDGPDLSDDAQAINEIIHEVWENWSWVVLVD